MDDDPLMLTLARTCLEQSGFDIEEAIDGYEALAAFDQLHPDLVVLDIIMPGLNGFDTCAAIRERVTGKFVPILMVTGGDDVESVERAYQVGATDFTAKPIDWALFPHRLRYMLRCAQTQSKLQAAEHVADATRSKSEFLANMNHEIRTPMTAILGHAEELIEGGDMTRIPPHRLRAIDAIKSNGAHLLRLIDDILDLSKVEAGRLSVERIRFSPIQLLAEVSSIVLPEATRKELSVSIEFRTSIPEMIEGDPTRIRQVLINLLGNAVKFTHEGAIRLVVRHFDPADATMQFEVIDSGVGMAREEIAHLFEAFTQSDASTTRQYGGTGLGLAICKRLVELMGGVLDVESKLGVGSTFRVSLPIGSAKDATLIENPLDVLYAAGPTDTDSAEELPAQLQDCRLLLAEDGPDNQRLIGLILRKAGADVEIAENGSIALERALKAVEDGQPFDVILMDMQMPLLDGCEATRALRKANYDRPIIALTAHAMLSDREKCYEAGCDDFLTKPVNKRRLISTVFQYMGTKSKPRALSSDE